MMKMELKQKGYCFKSKAILFILCLLLCEKLFCITSKLSELLQAVQIDFASACTQIAATIVA